MTAPPSARTAPAVPSPPAWEAGRFALLQTAHGTVLALDRPSGEVVTIAAGTGDERRVPLTAYLPGGRPDLCLLLLPDEASLRLPPDLAGRGILPLGMARDGGEGWAFYHPDNGRWLCAGPPPPEGAADRTGRLIADRVRIAGFERFRLLPAAPVAVAGEVAVKAARFEHLLARPFDLAMLREAAPEDAPLIDALGRLVPQETLVGLARAVGDQAADVARLARLFPADLAAAHGLPALLAHTAGAPGAGDEVGPEFDGLDAVLGTSPYVSLPFALNAIARAATRPQRDLCIVAVARNEGAYLLDWLAYHRAIGVERIFLYTNDNDDGSDRLLAALAAAGAVTWLRNRLGSAVPPQMKAYGHALSILPGTLEYRWALMIDIDEFLVVDPSRFASPREFLGWHEALQSDAIGLNWMMLGSNRQGRWADGFVARRFPAPAEGPNRHIKTLFRPRLFNRASAHHPRSWRDRPFRFVLASGAEHAASASSGKLAHSDAPCGDFAWINHYWFRSTEEFLLKFARNTGDHPVQGGAAPDRLHPNIVRLFMQQFDRDVPARVQPEECAPRFEAERASLLALPGVAAAAAEVRDLFAARLRDLVPRLLDAPGIKAAGEAGEAFVATLNRG